jgi:hypothetical protein
VTRARPFLLAFAWGLVVAVGLYGAVRAIQFLIFPEPNPALIVWSAHAGYFWRIWIVSYAGGMAAFVAYVVGRDRERGSARALVPALSIATAVLSLQGVLLP